jgi:hypothetical protein
MIVVSSFVFLPIASAGPAQRRRGLRSGEETASVASDVDSPVPSRFPRQTSSEEGRLFDSVWEGMMSARKSHSSTPSEDDGFYNINVPEDFMKDAVPPASESNYDYSGLQFPGSSRSLSPKDLATDTVRLALEVIL